MVREVYNSVSAQIRCSLGRRSMGQNTIESSLTVWGVLAMRSLLLAVSVSLVAVLGLGTANAANPIFAVIKTSMGEIKIELDIEKAPITVENFIKYAEDGHYKDTIFHRVIPGFMVQGGGMTMEMKEKKTREPIKNESSNGLLNEPYTLAMARTNAPDSATSQFFINVANNEFLNKARARDRVGYAVFGKVVEGKDVVDKIVKVKTKSHGPHDDVPVEHILIETIEILKESK